MAKDTPSKPTLTADQLDAEVDVPEPFVYMTKASKRVRFPDLYDMEASEGEEFLSQLGTRTDGAFLKEWLPEADFEALQAEKLTLRSRMTLMRMVLAHYEVSMGDAGEGSASAS